MGSGPLGPTAPLTSWMLIAGCLGSGTLRPASPGDSNHGWSPNLELPETQRQPGTRSLGVLPSRAVVSLWTGTMYSFHRWKNSSEFQNLLGLFFLTPALGTIYARSEFSTFFWIFFTSYKTWSSLGRGGAFPLLTVLNSKLSCHLWNCIWGSFPFSGLGPHVECRRIHRASQLEVLSAISLTTFHWLWGTCFFILVSLKQRHLFQSVGSYIQQNTV